MNHSNPFAFIVVRLHRRVWIATAVVALMFGLAEIRALPSSIGPDPGGEPSPGWISSGRISPGAAGRLLSGRSFSRLGAKAAVPRTDTDHVGPMRGFDRRQTSAPVTGGAEHRKPAARRVVGSLPIPLGRQLWRPWVLFGLGLLLGALVSSRRGSKRDPSSAGDWGGREELALPGSAYRSREAGDVSVVISGQGRESARHGGSLGRIVRRSEKRREASRKSGHPFEQAMQLSPMGLARMSTDGCWLEVNEALCRFLGYEREELLATTPQAITHPEDLDLDLGYVRQMLDREIDMYRTEKRFFHSSGRVVWALSNVSLVWGADHAPRYFIVQVLDITSRKRNDSILRSVVAGLSDFDGESYYREAALRIADILGMDLALIGRFDAVSRQVHTLAVVEAGEPLPNFSYACDKGPCAEVLAGSTVIVERGAGHRFADGDLLMEKGIELYGGVPIRDPNGQVIGHLAVMRRAPLDEDASLSESLRILGLAISAFMVAARSRRQYRDLFELTPDPVVMASPTGAIILMNRNAENAFGWRREQKIGEQICTLFSDLGSGRSSFNRWLRGEGALAEPMKADGSLLEARRQDGTVFPVEARYRLLEIGRGPVVALVLRDVSDRQMLEKQLREARKMESIGQLTAGIAHDFKNMLTVVKITAQLASDRLDGDDPLRGEMGAILKASEEASRLTRQLLAFGRRQVLKPIELDLNHAVSETGELLERVLGDHILLDLKLEEDVPHVKIDPCQFQQVILNLAVNSRDAMHETGGTLAIETRAVVVGEEYQKSQLDIRPGLYSMVAVSDTGVGMDTETKNHLFEPFFTTKKRGKGTGLGLATVYGIVKQSSGDIRVDSELGQGTTFRVYFPATDQKAVVARRNLQPSMAGGSEHILIADDELVVRKLAKRILDRAGYRVQVASDATEAVEILEKVEDPIDLLLTDIMMPDKKGTELAREVRQRHPETRILYTSGYTDDVIVQECILGRDVHFLSKPFTVDDLVAKVREALES